MNSDRAKNARLEEGAGLSIKEAAAYMGCSYRTMWDYVAARVVQSYPVGKSGKHRRVTRVACDELRRKLCADHDPPAIVERMFPRGPVRTDNSIETLPQVEFHKLWT